MYESGDLKSIVGPCELPCEIFEHEHGSGQALSRSPDGTVPVAFLPHSCEEWVIGGVAEARALIFDLEEFVAAAQGS